MKMKKEEEECWKTSRMSETNDLNCIVELLSRKLALEVRMDWRMHEKRISFFLKPLN